MARRSQRLSSGGGTTKHKRVPSGPTTAGSASKRIKRERSTPSKSEFFVAKPKDEDVEPDDSADETPSNDEETGSEFDHDDDNSVHSDEESAEEGTDSDDESEEHIPKTKTNRKSNTSEVWRPGVKAGLGPGTQVVIKKPKARAAGGTPYTDNTIHPNTLLFLADLKKNNDRQWLKLHDAEFRQAEKDWHSFVEKMTEKLMEIDDTIPELPVKDVIFRIYRDVRFSKDPTPYKPHFSVAWSRAGRKSSYAHYYVQIAPGKSFVGGGLWHPEPAPTAAMRTAIDRNSKMIKDVLVGESIRKEFLRGAGNSHAAAVKAFVKSNAESSLKTKPKGYDSEHPDIELLRMRSYTLGHKLEDVDVLGDTGARRIAGLLASLKPFITYCNQIVLPDDDQDDEDDDDDEQADEDESADSSETGVADG